MSGRNVNIVFILQGNELHRIGRKRCDGDHESRDLVGCTQSAETSLRRQNSLLARKEQGIYLLLDCFLDFGDGKRRILLRFQSKFPTRRCWVFSGTIIRLSRGLRSRSRDSPPFVTFEDARIGIHIGESRFIRLQCRDRPELRAGRHRKILLQRFAGLRFTTGQSQRRSEDCGNGLLGPIAIARRAQSIA